MSTQVAEKKKSGMLSAWLHRSPLGAWRDEIQELLAQPLVEGEDLWAALRNAPSVDLSEKNGTVEVRMDIPGVDSKDLDIQLNDNMLTVRGERKEEKEEKGTTYYRTERRMGSIFRSVTLPCAVKKDGVEATYRDGVLTITMPKSDVSQVTKIQVKS